MIKFLYKIINPFRKVYWYIFRPKTYGVKCLIEFNGKYLLIKNTYGHKQWTLPGGGVNKKESAIEAVIREIKEEVDIEITNPEYIGEYFSTRQYKRDTVFCYYAQVKENFYKIDNQEISEACWFTKSEIPKEHSFAIVEIFRLKEKRVNHPF